ncbi:MAG: ABC transporter ATP-binding protein/permease [Spirochaetaceae bacterium]|jgi:ATP-binding cassette subfamily B protein|nr:ABC transporter ATP-binding protein/permease [Spirochaetaceae bacterium]
MADYFEVEEVVKGYNSGIVRRILSYVKPYRTLAVITALTLVISTLGELVIPVLEQRLIDGAILARFFAISGDRLSREEKNLDQETRDSLDRLLKAPQALSAGGLIFIPQDQNTRLPGRLEETLKDRGILLDDPWYAFSLRAGDPAGPVIENHRDLFFREGDVAAIRTGDLYSLSVPEIRAVRDRDLSRIFRVFLFLFILLIFVFIFTFIQTWTTTLIGQGVMKDMRLELFRKTASQSTDFLSRHPVGRIVTRLTGDVETINEFFSSVLVAFIKDLSVMAGALITLFFLAPALAAVTLLTMSPVAVITAVSRVRARDAFRRQRTASSRVNAYLSERLSGVQVVQLFLGERKSLGEFGERNREYLRANLEEMYVFAVFRPLIDFLATITTATVIVVGASMILSLSLSLGVLIAFINLVGMFYSPVMDIAEKYTLLQSAMAGGERVFKLLDTQEGIPDEGKKHVEGMVRGHIEFEDVRFSYKKGEEILRGLTFTVNPGEMAAIVGYTGAGKTTITNVLARLWDIDSGAIRIDGMDIKDIPLQELRRSVLPVLQEVFLFSGTVAENISLGLPLSEREIEEAARAVHAHEFISLLPQGYETKLSEGAANISSGQRQLISFARVIAHNPAIVVLDEATSSIDTETEHLIQLGIQRVLAGRTSLVIAHRLSTIRHADRILVLSGGVLAEEGKHQDLIDKNGLYAGLYRLQYTAGGEDL